MQLKQALIKNTGWNFIGLFFTFINNIFIVRILGAASSGSFFYSIAFLILLVILLRLGVENGLTYFGAKSQSFTGFLLSLLFPLSALQWFSCYLVLIKFKHPIQFFSPVWASTFVTANIFLYYTTAFFHARKQFSAINIISTISTLIQCMVLGYCYFNQGAAFTGLMINDTYTRLFEILTITTVLQVVATLIVFVVQNKDVFIGYSFNIKLVGDLVKYSGFNYLNAILVFLGTRMDFYFVEKYCTLGELGNYIQAAKIGQLGMVLPGLIGGVVFPFAISSGNGFSEKVASLCRLVTSLFIFVFIGTLFFGYFLFPLLLGNEFTLVYKIVLITLAGIACMGLSIILMSYFEGKNLQRIILYSNATALGLILLGDYLFVEQYGYLAAASVFTTGNIAGLGIFLYFFTKQSGLKVRTMFFVRRSDLLTLFSYLKG